MRMGDLVLAGKYLFLSGARDPEYAAAIALYIKQHGRGGWRTMAGTFPNAVRKLPIEQLPAPLREDFADFSARKTATLATPSTARTKLRSAIEPLGCIFMALLGLGLMISISEVVHMLWHGFLSLFK
jgi:hypothetical protein